MRNRPQRIRSARIRVARAVSAFLLLLVTGCGVEEVLLAPFRGETPRDRYEASLERAGLGSSQMVRAWHQAGARALTSAVAAVPPLIEEAWLSPEEPAALGYRLTLRRGEQVEVEVRGQPEDQRYFVELYRERDSDEGEEPLLVRWSEDAERGLVYDARATSGYLLRIQPELLGGGAVEVAIRVGASVAFPVQDRSTRNVLSFFGDIRDGGARDHHGVDIFAPRGTPVLAATAGTAYRVSETARGGKVVWVRDPTGEIRSYYAHLDLQLVEEGAEVRVGDVLGLVGNTGNAITTPPHLHFGIYLRRGGAVDPFPYLHEPEGTAAPLGVPREEFRETRWVRSAGVSLQSSPNQRATAVALLDERSTVRIVGGSGRWFRVRTSDGLEGYLPDTALEPIEGGVDRETRLAFAFPCAVVPTC